MFLEDPLEVSELQTRREIGLPPRIYYFFGEEELHGAIGLDRKEYVIIPRSVEEIKSSLEGRSGTAELEHLGPEEPELMREEFGDGTQYRDGSNFLEEQLEQFNTTSSCRIMSRDEESYFLQATDTANYETRYLHNRIPFRWPNHLFMEVELEGEREARINAKYMPMGKIRAEQYTKDLTQTR